MKTPTKERIYIRAYSETNPCDTCKDTSGEECDFCVENYEWNGSISRAEAIDKIAKAIKENEGWGSKDLAEAALNALLGG